MRLILLLIGGLVLANIVSATFIWPPSNGAPGPREPIVNSATQQGGEPWLDREKSLTGFRDNVRRNVFATLEKPWSSYCTPDGHKELINTVNYYYYQREGELLSKVSAYGERARHFAIEMWSTTDDNRIERLIGETYGRGYFTLKELESRARTGLAAQTRDVQVVSKPCSG